MAFITIDGFRTRVGSRLYRWLVKTKRFRHGWHPKPKPKPEAVTMYDSVSVSEIPKDAKAVAGYVGGRWPTFSTLVKEFPKAKRLSIAIAASEDAECLDVETGDALVSQAPAWVRRQQKRGIKRPVVYTAVSWAPKVIDALAKAGVKRSEYRLWTAHYRADLAPHLCGPECGFGFRGRADATQYTDKALGRNLDASFCSPSFFS